MNKKGFAAMYMVYSLFLIFILMMLTVLLINNYKASSGMYLHIRASFSFIK